MQPASTPHKRRRLLPRRQFLRQLFRPHPRAIQAVRSRRGALPFLPHRFRRALIDRRQSGVGPFPASRLRPRQFPRHLFRPPPRCIQAIRSLQEVVPFLPHRFRPRRRRAQVFRSQKGALPFPQRRLCLRFRRAQTFRSRQGVEQFLRSLLCPQPGSAQKSRRQRRVVSFHPRRHRMHRYCTPTSRVQQEIQLSNAEVFRSRKGARPFPQRRLCLRFRRAQKSRCPK
jgi:hypothetical protein